MLPVTGLRCSICAGAGPDPLVSSLLLAWVCTPRRLQLCFGCWYSELHNIHMHAHMWGWGSHQSLALDYLCVSWACLVSQLLHKDGCSAWVVPGIWLYHLSTSKPPDMKTFGAGWDLLVLTAAHALRLQRDSALQPLCYLADKPMTLFVGESSLELASNSAPLCTPTCCAHSGQGSPVPGTADKWAPVIRGCLLHFRACMCTQNRAPLYPGMQK